MFREWNFVTILEARVCAKDITEIVSFTHLKEEGELKKCAS